MTHKDVIVVGGGIAGLTAALTLAGAGKEVLLVEKNDHCGGLMNSFVREGFRFEGGARALVNAGLVRPLIKEFGLDLEILPNPITLGVENSFVAIEGEKSLEGYARLLKGLYPGSEADVDEIVLAIHDIIEDMKVLYGVDSPLFAEKRKNPLALAPAAIAWMARFLKTIYRITRMDQPFERRLDELSANSSLKDIVGQHFFRKTPVFFALSYFALYSDYIYPRGGVGALIGKLVDALRERGGELRLDTRVVAVEPEARLVRDAAGNEYRYDRLVWAADLKALYAMSADAGMDARVKTAFTSTRDNMLSHRGAESVFTVFLGVDLPPETFGKVASGHVFYTPDRRGLGDLHTTELQDLLKRWDSLSKEELYAWLHRFCAYNTFEISIPVLRDPGAAPAGKTGIIASLLFDFELTERIRASGWYENFKRQAESEFIGILSESLYPGLRDRILFSFSASPLSIRDRAGSSEGSIVGWSFESEIPAVTSMVRMADSVKTALPDVFAAGKWVYSPAGGPTAIMTGRMAAKECLKGLRRTGGGGGR